MNGTRREEHGLSFKACLEARTRFGRDVFLISIIFGVICDKSWRNL
jgi:hypothetical protein